MSYEFFNPNPKGILVGDCVIRALAKALRKSWTDVYSDICVKGLEMADMPSSNIVWGTYLMDHGFHRVELPRMMNAIDFCREHPRGEFVLCTGTHIIAVEDGTIYDAWDSSLCMIYYYWERKNG